MIRYEKPQVEEQTITMAKLKGTKGQICIYKILNRKLKIEQNVTY